MGASVSVAQGAPLDAGTYKADEAAVERFCELLRIPTVSRENIAERDDEPFNQWIPTLQRLYPHFFKVAELTRVDDLAWCRFRLGPHRHDGAPGRRARRGARLEA